LIFNWYFEIGQLNICTNAR